MTKREELVSKFFRNKNLVRKFRKEYEEYLNKTNTWDNQMFTDSNITNRQYLIALDEISQKEYSEIQGRAIKSVYIHENAVLEYICNLDIQHQNLTILYNSIQ